MFACSMFQIQHAGKRWPWCNIPVNLGDNRCRCRRRSISFVWFMSAELRAPHNRIFLCAISSAYNEAARIMWGQSFNSTAKFKAPQPFGPFSFERKGRFSFKELFKVQIQQKCVNI